MGGTRFRRVDHRTHRILTVHRRIPAVCRDKRRTRENGKIPGSGVRFCRRSNFFIHPINGRRLRRYDSIGAVSHRVRDGNRASVRMHPDALEPGLQVADILRLASLSVEDDHLGPDQIGALQGGLIFFQGVHLPRFQEKIGLGTFRHRLVQKDDIVREHRKFFYGIFFLISGKSRQRFRGFRTHHQQHFLRYICGINLRQRSQRRVVFPEHGKSFVHGQNDRSGKFFAAQSRQRRFVRHFRRDGGLSHKTAGIVKFGQIFRFCDRTGPRARQKQTSGAQRTRNDNAQLFELHNSQTSDKFF